MAGTNFKKLAFLAKNNELDIHISVSPIFDGVLIRIAKQINEYSQIATERGVNWTELIESSDDMVDWLIYDMIYELDHKV